MRRAFVDEAHYGGRVKVRIFHQNDGIDELEFNTVADAETFLHKAGWHKSQQSAGTWEENDVPYFYPVMVPPPFSAPFPTEVAGKLGEVHIIICVYSLDSTATRWAFCYRFRVTGKSLTFSGYDPLLGSLCPVGVRAGGVGVWPDQQLATNMGLELFKTWKETYGDTLTQAVDCYIRREDLRKGRTAGLYVEGV